MPTLNHLGQIPNIPRYSANCIDHMKNPLELFRTTREYVSVVSL